MTLDQIKNVDERIAFIHKNLICSDWWHTDRLISYVADLNKTKRLRERSGLFSPSY